MCSLALHKAKTQWLKEFRQDLPSPNPTSDCLAFCRLESWIVRLHRVTIPPPGVSKMLFCDQAKIGSLLITGSRCIF